MRDLNTLYFTKTHEWVDPVDDGDIESDIAAIGISHIATKHMTDVTFVDLPRVGKSITAGSVVATIETLKTVMDVYSPIDGEIIEVNDSLTTEPSPINNEPYDNGWIVKIRPSDSNQMNSLMRYDEYKKVIE